MGGKSSKSELNRSKSFSTFGRSSQRSLFQKSKLALNQINKKLLKVEAANQEEIETQLEKIEKELNGVSPSIKEKNKQKFEDILNYFQETKKKFDEKFQLAEETANVEEASPKLENGRQVVELKLVKVATSTDNLNEEENIKEDVRDEQEVEIRKSLQNDNGGKEEAEEGGGEINVPASPKVKFGVQVMPMNPRISQELLKRNTLPENEVPKQEFKKIRNISESAETRSMLQQLEVFQASISCPNSPNSNKSVALETFEKREVDVEALETIESITKNVDMLENRLKYFKGRKSDRNYMELQELLIRNLIKLDDIEVDGDPVVRRERKISIQRIQDLMKILEHLVDEEDGIDGDSGDEDEERSGLKNQEEVLNLEGKPITATKL